MSRTWMIGLVMTALIAPAARAQEGGVAAASAEHKRALEQARVIAHAVETRTTTGRPYSAEAVTETLQVLGDGNRISRSSSTKVYRDSEGRSRREVLAEDGSVRSITISDPGAHASYMLDPKTKTAARAGGNIVVPLRTPDGNTHTYTLKRAGEAHATATARVAEEMVAAGRAGGRGGGSGAVMARVPAADNPNVRKEDLGSQNIEGVMATGTRTTTVIPAGEIGNAQEIRVVSERWFSDELQVLVMTRHSDPRSGETTYRLRNILRAEPDPSLFTVPPDYTIQQRRVREPE